jgi:hypothetical protein
MVRKFWYFASVHLWLKEVPGQLGSSSSGICWCQPSHAFRSSSSDTRVVGTSAYRVLALYVWTRPPSSVVRMTDGQSNVFLKSRRYFIRRMTLRRLPPVRSSRSFIQSVKPAGLVSSNLFSS